MTRHNPQYWIAKIARNIARDREQKARLEEVGWTVIRVWETEVKRDPAAVARQIKAILDCRRDAPTRFS